MNDRLTCVSDDMMLKIKITLADAKYVTENLVRLLTKAAPGSPVERVNVFLNDLESLMRSLDELQCKKR